MSPPELSVLLVHYHAPVDAARAVASVGQEAREAGLAVEVVLIDNGSTDDERRLLADLPVRRVGTGENLGYAGGLNLGARHARGEVLAAMNPDVRLLPGCLAALVAEIRAGAAAAGPCFFLDRQERLRIPPTEERTRRGDLAARLAERGPRWAARPRRRWRRHARRHWCAEQPFDSLSLSGALVLFPRRVWEEVPFDDGYPLYFEEDDWLRRLGDRGLAGRYVPAARAVHFYNRSAGREPRSADWFECSRARFERRWYGRWFSPSARLLSPRRPARRFPEAVPLGAGPPVIERLPRAEELWIELALSVKGFPAAAERLPAGPAEPWRLPEDAWTALAAGMYLLQAVDGRGRELARWTFERCPES